MDSVRVTSGENGVGVVVTDMSASGEIPIDAAGVVKVVLRIVGDTVLAMRNADNTSSITILATQDSVGGHSISVRDETGSPLQVSAGGTAEAREAFQIEHDGWFWYVIGTVLASGQLPPPPVDPPVLVLKSQGRTATASSTETGGVYVAANAVDGLATTRWAGAWTAPGSTTYDSSLMVDLTEPQKVSRIVVGWGYSYATSYIVERSSDGVTWTAQSATITNTASGQRTHDFTEGTYRYWRIRTTARDAESAANGWSVSAYEVQFWGNETAGETLPATTPPPSPGGLVFWQDWHASSPYVAPLPDSAPLMGSSVQTARRNELRYMANVGACGVENGVWSGRNGIVNGSNVTWPDGTVIGSGSDKALSNVGQTLPALPYVQGLYYTGGEAHHSLWEEATGEYAEWIHASGSGSTLTGGYGAGAVNTALLKQMNETAAGNVPERASPWGCVRGANAAGIPMSVTTIADHEIRNAVAAYGSGDTANAYIPHLIGYEGYRHHPNQWEYPATKTDDIGSSVTAWGVGGDSNRGGHGLGVIPMGSIMRVVSDLDVFAQTFGLSNATEIMLARIIARTWQRHGATYCDWTGAGFVLLQENRPGSYDMRAGSTTNHSPYMRTFVNWLCDNQKVVWVNTGRNREIETIGGAPDAGTYRPA